MATTRPEELTDEQRADAKAAHVRETDRERAEALQRRISREAAIYSTCFEEIRRRLEPYATWKVESDGTKVPPLLSGSDIKDAATSLFIQVSRSGTWIR